MAKKRKASGKKSNGSRKFWRGVGIFLLVIIGLSIVMPILYRWINPPVTILMINRKIKDKAPIEKEWVDIEHISPYLISASVAAEDNNFLGHRGFDWGAIQKAIDERESGKRKRGASTISQQTAKNVFLWPKQSWVRKGAEVYFTFMIETFWSKERIMEVYLNVIEMGDGIYGAEAASQHYFNKNAENLTRRQACLIAGSYPNPRKFNPGKPSAYLSGRADHLCGLTRMIGTIHFDKEHVQKAKERYQKREEKRRAKHDGKILDLHLDKK